MSPFLKGTYHKESLPLFCCCLSVIPLFLASRWKRTGPHDNLLRASYIILLPTFITFLLDIHTARIPLLRWPSRWHWMFLASQWLRLLSLILEPSQSLAFYCKSPRKLLDNWKWFWKPSLIFIKKLIHFCSTLVLLTSPQSYKAQVSLYV